MDITQLIKQFKFERLLKSDPQTKQIVVLGTVENEHAIVTIEKSHFLVEGNIEVNDIINELKLIQNNDVYYWSSSTINQELPDTPGAKVNVIYPATETHIRKYSPQKFHMVLETPEMYENYVVPYIETMKGDRIKWVYNILFEGKESESFVYHDKDLETGFVLLPDMKWDRISLDSLYLCTIVNRKDISSVRDLTGDHIEYLKTLKSTILKVTSEKYAIDKDELRLFVHYQPSYYHFHIHVVTVKHPGLGDGINVGKAILLDDIIENLKLSSSYYQKRTIPYLLGENHGLWKIQGYRDQC
ncbi:inactive diphosphatase Dcs2p [[Candida] jaroonii]|uniref:Inactive diphosphatase Dcs2p n=1 Tax=[Candida] jaroonii TaxID=467808 RepID=A0ACA9Y4N2_9ASCO|nr:inactive diphosphatase Dcs2p [[Candida] jaroonii]